MTFGEQNPAPRILVVDDSPIVHREFETVLLEGLDSMAEPADAQRLVGHSGPPGPLPPACELDHAFSGLEGVEKVRQALAQARPYQLGFVDIRMPGIDGIETVARIWELDPAMQIVICTAYADHSGDELSRRLGGTDKLLVLKKPFDGIEVAQMASTLARKWFLARQAALKFEQLERLVAERTQRLLALQRRDAAEEPGPAASVATAGAEPTEPRKDRPLLLLVEDQPEISETLRRAFSPECRVTVAKDVDRALGEARESVPDLILVDAAMPRCDGIALCHSLKSDELTSHIPVVLLGARDREEAQIRALEAGADDYLVKPLSVELLRARVHNLLRSRQKPQDPAAGDVTLQPRDLAASQIDALFLQRILDTVEKHLPDFEFDVDVLARTLGVSRRQLFRKLKAVTGRTPHSLIRTMRLHRAAQLLKESQLTITEITYAVGFSDLKHFRTVFREHFGVLPGEYLRKGAARAA